MTGRARHLANLRAAETRGATVPTYTTFTDCCESGNHLASCDEDGYCNGCGYSQPSPLLRDHLDHDIVCQTVQHEAYRTQVEDGVVYITKGVHYEVAETAFQCATCDDMTITVPDDQYEWNT